MISITEIRDAIRKDDLPYVNNEIQRLLPIAQATFFAKTGWRIGGENKTLAVASKDMPKFEALTDSFVTEFIRTQFDQIDNAVTLDIIAVQCETYIKEADGDGSKGEESKD